MDFVFELTDITSFSIEGKSPYDYLLEINLNLKVYNIEFSLEGFYKNYFDKMRQ